VLSVPIRCKEFVGRALEFEHLVARRRSAADLKGGAVLIGGEPGIGKSRLVDEFVAACSRSTVRIARTACREFAQSTFGPIVDIVAQLGEPTDFIGSSASEEAQLHRLLQAIARSSARRTTVIVVEDLHWATKELVLSLRLVAAAAESQRVLLVLTYRDNELGSSHPSFIALGKLTRERSVSVVTLRPFERELMLTVLTGALGPAQRLPHVVLDRVAKRSEGNPLYAEEMLRHVVDAREAGAGEGDDVPISLQAVVRERIERCTPRERGVLAMAALFARDLDAAELETIAGEDAPTERELSSLVEHQLLVRDAAGRFRFHHALTRDVIYADILEGAARPIHQRIADALEAAQSSSIAEIAHHRWHSGDLASAAASAEAAGALARAEFAYPECIRWYERAIVAYGEDSHAANRVRLELGKALVAAHEIERGLAAYTSVVAWARHRDVSLFVRARRLIAGTIANDGRPDDAIALLVDTRSSLDATADPSFSTGLTIRIASCSLIKENMSEARRELALLDPTVLDSGQRAEFYLLRSTISGHEPAEDAAWRADSAQAVALYRELGALPFVHYAEVQFALQAFGRGNLRDARAALERAEDASLENASSFNELPLTYALLENAAGNLGASRTWLGRVRPSPQLISRATERLARLELSLALDDVTDLGGLVDVALAEELLSADATNGVRLGVATAQAFVRLGHLARAHELLERFAPCAGRPYQTTIAMLGVASLRPDLCLTYRKRLALEARTPFLDAIATTFELECEPSVPRAAVAKALAFFDSEGWAQLAARVAELSGDLTDAAQRYRAIGNVAALRRIGFAAFRPTHETTVDAGLTHLTGREREVARLVANGKSNREVAASLSVSSKTVEKYLTLLYGKLGIQSRAQLAALFSRAGDT
jgi:DNA-binding CsgD family transcriptional regulator